jgi:catechol 2,3-dioxygenase-like lactoylglutathione lyase family enzyme
VIDNVRRSVANPRQEGVMLAGKEIVGTVAVKDLAVARKFYEGILGLEVVSEQGSEAHVYRSGETRLFVYRSQFAGTNQATALNFVVGGDLDAVVKDLRARGVAFEHYDMPGLKREGDVHIGGPVRAAWFKDPDGNILCVMNG